MSRNPNEFYSVEEKEAMADELRDRAATSDAPAPLTITEIATLLKIADDAAHWKAEAERLRALLQDLSENLPQKSMRDYIKARLVREEKP